MEDLDAAPLARDTAGLPPTENDGRRGRSPLHKLVQWSKLDLVRDAITADHFGTNSYAWIDAGLAHVARPPETFPAPSDPIAVLEMRPVFPEEVEDRAEFVRYERGRIAGGFLRGAKASWLELADAFDAELRSLLALGLRPNEQMVLGILSAERPDLFSAYYGDYASILRNWDGVRGEVSTVLLNVAHCRMHERLDAAMERCRALRTAEAAGIVALAREELERLDEEEAFAFAHRPREPPARRGIEPCVSAVIPVYDGAATIERSVRSALDQTAHLLEVVVVDDASTDESAAIVERIAAEDDRVRLVRREQNSGSPATPRDDAIAVARGSLIALLDQDDYWLPHKLEVQVALFDDREIAVVYSDAYVVDARGSPPRRSGPLPSGDLTADLAEHNVVPSPTAVIRRTWVDEVGRFDDGELVGTDDHYYWARVAFRGGRFFAVQEPLAVHAQHGASLGSSRSQEVWESACRVYDLLAEEFPDRAHLLSHPRPTIALCMIVRDEAAVIERCLTSARGLIDAWVIVDTGSVDGTPEIIERCLADLPGELHHRPWRDFGTNRTELLEVARHRADYLLLLDADMTVRHDGPIIGEDADALLVRHDGELDYAVPRLLRGDRPWRFQGTTHEHLAADEPFTTGLLSGLTIEHHADGGSRADKLPRDRDLLEAAIARDPTDARATFYLAQTYRDLGDRARAIELYRRRVELGGWEEEVFYAAFQQGVLVADIDWSLGLPLLLEAWERRPARVEPLYEIAVRARAAHQPHVAHMATTMGVGAPLPGDVLFMHRPVYEWGMRFEHSVAAALVGDLDAALAMSEDLLLDQRVPQDIAAHVRSNLAWCRSRLAGAHGLPLLDELVSGLTVQHMPAVPADEGWVQTNPSIARDDHGLAAIVRTVNYRLVDGRYEMVDRDGVVRTKNVLAHLGDDLSIASLALLREPASPPRHATRVRGLEDGRLVSWRGSWWLSATARDLDPDEVCRMALARIEGTHLRDVEVLEGPTPGRHEKNWMPFTIGDDLLFVYQAHPFTVLRWDPDERSLHEVARVATPPWWAGLRGSSQGLPIDGGHLFVVHEAEVVSGDRRYAHRLLSVDGRLRPTGLSPAFAFVHHGTEFCAGLARRGDDLLISFGIEDRDAAIAIIDLDAAIDLIAPLGDGSG